MNKFERQFVSLLKDRLEEDSPLIQVLMGPRQVGKTTGVLQFLKKYSGVHHYCSADDMLVGDQTWILEQWQCALQKGKGALLVIDEIQKIPQWADVIKKLWDGQKVKEAQIKLILLGSSSLSLTQGASESLAGRFEYIPVAHWDYVESQALHDMDIDTYLKYGGYPKSYDYLKDINRWTGYIRDAIIDRVIDKDILQFALIKNPALFRQAFEILSCYPAQEISYRKILGQLQDKGNTELVKGYLALFEGAYLFKSLQKYGSQEFKVKSSSPKILVLAPWFYTAFSTHGQKYEFVFESTVGAKLNQLSKDLYYWREGNDEVDFILKWQQRVFAIEVKSGRKRRAGGLNKFLTLHPKAIPVIISRDNYEAFIQNPNTFLTNLI
jgi:predicted AAA+ superfamily ATPase